MRSLSMMRLATAFACVLAVVACSSSSPKRQLTPQEMIALDPLPLAKGAKWTYTVKVKRYDAASDKETTSTMDWTTEVLDAREANGVTAYRVKGWPSDLADFDGAAQPVPSEKTLLRSGNSFLFGTNGDPTLDGAEGWFSWPVIDGQRICPSAEVVYCWRVTSVDTGYALSFHTGPDEQTFELEPGTGVARYHYAHHGTINEVDAKLVSYTAGKK